MAVAPEDSLKLPSFWILSLSNGLPQGLGHTTQLAHTRCPRPRGPNHKSRWHGKIKEIIPVEGSSPWWRFSNFLSGLCGSSSSEFFGMICLVYSLQIIQLLLYLISLYHMLFFFCIHFYSFTSVTHVSIRHMIVIFVGLIGPYGL